MMSKKRWLLASLLSFVAMVLTFSLTVAQEGKKAADAEVKKDAPVEEKKADEAPKLPSYFTATSADAKKPDWPDPTGGKAGDTAAPASDAKGDIPSKLSSEDLYNRITHNLYS